MATLTKPFGTAGVWNTELMIGPTLCAALLLGSPPQAGDLKSLLNTRYRQFNEALLKNDAKSLARWVSANLAPTFRYTSKDGNSYGRDAFGKGLRDQVAMTKKPLSSKLTLRRITQQGRQATAVVDSVFQGLVNFDTATLKLVDHSTTTDTWQRQGADWKLVRSVQTKADTQMFNP